MTTCGTAWRNAALIVGAVGVTIALLGEDPLVTLTVAGSVGFTSGVFAYLVEEARANPRHQVQALVVLAYVTGAGFGLTGLIALDAELAVVVVSLLTITSPPACVGYRTALRRLTRRTRESTADSSEPSQASNPAPAPAPAPIDATTAQRLASTLSDTELCSAWQGSSREIEWARKAGDPVQQAQLVAVRQGYLDELERRDPPGFDRWLEVSADSTSDPSTFFTGAVRRTGECEDEAPRT